MIRTMIVMVKAIGIKKIIDPIARVKTKSTDDCIDDAD